MSELEYYMSGLGRAVKAASSALRLAPTEQRNAALEAMAQEIRARSSDILKANEIDMQAGQQKGLSAAMLDRLRLDPARIEGIAKGLDDIAALPDPVGAIEKKWTQPNGLQFEKVRVPIGVIGMIYESRPNVTADAGGLCVKSGNACVLRGGSESTNSNAAIHRALQAGLVAAGLPKDSICLVNTTDRAAVGEMLRGLNGAIDLIIPRGGRGLVERVQQDARIPVLAHLEGLNHSYVHANADLNMAVEVIENAKLRRTGVCGATETILVDQAIAHEFLPALQRKIGNRCELRGDQKVRSILTDIKSATSEDFATEHLAAILNVAVVDGLNSALEHIDTYGSGHTDAILTRDTEVAQKFLNAVDSAIVIHNASTQYADGGEFGFGAEIGIATGRLHARGPVGAEHLTTYKYQVRGNGQVRP